MVYTPLTSTTFIDAYFRTPFGTDTQPTTAEITQWIVDGTNVLYSNLKGVYELSETPDADEIISIAPLKALCEEFVIENINFVLGRNTNSFRDDKTYVPTTIKHKNFYETLQKYIDGKLELDGIPKISTSSISSYNYVNTVEAVSRKDELIW